MEENKSNNKIYQVIVMIIFLIVIILGIVLNFNNNGWQNNSLNEVTNANTTNSTIIEEYENLSINENDLNIFYLNVGQGDSTFITINGVNMLIDCGNDSDGYYVSQFLKAQEVEKIDYFIVTHFDEDHMGGAYKIFEELEIGILYIPQGSNDTKTYEKFINSIEEYNINIDTTLVANKDKTYSLGNSEWKVLNINGDTQNDSSIVIELDYGNTKYLFMGDASSNVEEKVDWNEVDVLKVAHHGSSKSTTDEFLKIIKPTYAIISVGENNGYGFPEQAVLDNLENNNIEVYRTDEDGTIWITSDGENINIQTLDYNLDGAYRKQSMIFIESTFKCFLFLDSRHDKDHLLAIAIRTNPTSSSFNSEVQTISFGTGYST